MSLTTLKWILSVIASIVHIVNQDSRQCQDLIYKKNGGYKKKEELHDCFLSYETLEQFTLQIFNCQFQHFGSITIVFANNSTQTLK